MDTVKKLKYLDKNINQVLIMVQAVRDSGLVQGQDFDFAYYQETYDLFGHEPSRPRHVIFTFYDSKWASFFEIKWAGAI
jgi:hypothetical protein